MGFNVITAAPESDVVLIDTVTLSGDASKTISSSISADYKAYMIVCDITGITQNCDIGIRFNGDAGNNYAFTELQNPATMASSGGVGYYRLGSLINDSHSAQAIVKFFRAAGDGNQHACFGGCCYATKISYTGYWNGSADPITSVSIVASAGAMTGTCYIYGLKY